MTPLKKSYLVVRYVFVAAALLLGLAPGFGISAVSAQPPDPVESRLSPYTPSLQAATDPKPLVGDIELPMPCGATMILRPVCIPARDFFEDTEVSLGCENCGRPDEGFMEGKHTDSVSGPFTIEDLPRAWHKKLADSADGDFSLCRESGDEKGMDSYYFIGKYEVTHFQWEAVMEGTCPDTDAVVSADDPRPETDISWFEAIEFTRRYTEWLLKNSPRSLPSFSRGRPGYVRLPTETEWEYAARGGDRVSDSEMNHLEFFPLKGRSLSEYAVFTDDEGVRPPEKLAWIGTKRPNPLGLFDTAGNAAEMVLDPFRFSVDTRLQGASGGFVIKGGSYLKRKAEIMPGRREEMPFFLKDGAYRSADLGFRIVLSGIVTPDERTKALERQWAELSGRRKQTTPGSADSESMPEIDPNRDPIPELDRLLSATESPTMKKNLLALKNVIEEKNVILEEQKSETVKAIIWSALFTAESLRNYALRRKVVINELEELEEIKKATVPESVLESVAGDIAKASGTVNIFDAAIAYSTQSYIDCIEQSQKYPEGVFEKQFSLISHEVSLEADLGHRLTSRLELFKKHVDLYRKQGNKISPEVVLQDIVPETAR